MMEYMQENEADEHSENNELRRRLREEHQEVINKSESGHNVKTPEAL